MHADETATSRKAQPRSRSERLLGGAIWIAAAAAFFASGLFQDLRMLGLYGLGFVAFLLIAGFLVHSRKREGAERPWGWTTAYSLWALITIAWSAWWYFF